MRAYGLTACIREFDDEDLCRNVAEAERTLEKGKTTSIDELANCARTKERHEAAECLVALAEKDRPAAIAIAKTSDRTRHDYYSILATDLVAHPTEGSLEKYLASLGVTPVFAREERVFTVQHALAVYGRLSSFDTETGSVPNQHDELLTSVAAP